MKKVDSRRNAILASLRDTALAVAWQSISTPKVDSSMDRHAACAARDDRGGARLASERESNNSSPTTQAARLKNKKRPKSKHAQRWKDFEARIGALQGERGDKTSGLSHKRAAAIHDSSPKQAKRSFFRKANAKRSKL